MSELQQGKIAGEKVTQQQSGFKRADNRAEQVDAITGTAGAALKGAAKGSQQAIADDFAADDLTEIQVNQNVDLLEEDRANLLTDAQVNNGGTIQARQLSEQTDVALRRANLSQRGLQEALERNLISEKQAKTMANIALKRGSNTLIGSLITEPLRNIFAPTTGNPSGSPAVTFTKGVVEQEADLKRKVMLEERGKYEAKKQAIMVSTGKSEQGAEKTLRQQAADAAEIKSIELSLKRGEVSDEKIGRKASLNLSVKTEKIDTKLYELRKDGSLDANDINFLTSSVRQQADATLRQAREEGITQKGEKELIAKLDKYVETRNTYIKDQSTAKLDADALKAADAYIEKTKIQDFPITYAFAKIFPEATKAMGDKSFTEDQMKQFIKQNKGFKTDAEVDALVKKITDGIPSFDRVLNNDPFATQEDIEVVTTFMDSGAATPEAKAEVAKAEKENPKVAEKFAAQYRKAPASSIKGATGTLQSNLNSGGDEDSQDSYINSVAIGVKAIRENMSASPTYGDYEFSFDKVSGVLRPNGNSRGLVFPVAQAGQPDYPEEMKEQAKSVAKFMRDTPSYWAGQYPDWEAATLAALNEGKTFTPDEVRANHKESSTGNIPGVEGDILGSLGGVFQSGADAVLDSQNIGSGFVRNKPGVEPTKARPDREQLDIIIKGIESGELKVDAKVSKAIGDLTKRIMSGDTSKIVNPADPADVSGGAGKVIEGTGQAPATSARERSFALVEGNKSKVYDDSQGNKTVGIGFNMDSKTAKAQWTKSGITEDFDKVKAGNEELSPESTKKLLEVTTATAVDDAKGRAKELGQDFDKFPTWKQELLIDLSFNIGKKSLGQFSEVFKRTNPKAVLAAASRTEGGKNTKGLDNRVAKVGLSLGIIDTLQEAKDLGLDLADLTDKEVADIIASRGK